MVAIQLVLKYRRVVCYTAGVQKRVKGTEKGNCCIASVGVQKRVVAI